MPIRSASRQDHAEHGKRHGNGHALRVLKGTVQVQLRDVRDFVRQHSGHLVLIFGRQDQP